MQPKTIRLQGRLCSCGEVTGGPVSSRQCIEWQRPERGNRPQTPFASIYVRAPPERSSSFDFRECRELEILLRPCSTSGGLLTRSGLSGQSSHHLTPQLARQGLFSPCDTTHFRGQQTDALLKLRNREATSGRARTTHTEKAEWQLGREGGPCANTRQKCLSLFR